jgi:membrane-bound serine protease (ClpP class)
LNVIAEASARAEVIELAAEIVGAEGVAYTDLRPIGRVDIDGRLAEARATAWVARGTRVRVVRVEGNELIVEALA